MGAIANSFPSTQCIERVDFRAVSDAALMSLDMIAERYLPRGYRRGREWIALNPTRADATPGSFSLNLDKGVWADFAVDQKGADAIDLVAYLTGQSKLDAARELASILNVAPAQGSTALTGNVRSSAPRKASSVAASPTDARTAPTTFPDRTTPDQDGKPRFVVAGNEGPRIRNDEKRRHIYCQGGVPVRIKIMRNDGDAFNVFRVRSADGVTGWQYRKPDGFEAVPYFVGSNPFDADPEQPIYWPEGEKDADTLAKLGLLAFTFGGCGDGLPAGCEQYLAGRQVVILADNDDEGRKHAEKKAALALPVASSVRVVHFEELPNKGDVSDWINAGHTRDGLTARVEASSLQEPVVANETESATGTVLPFGYKFGDRGLMWTNPDDDDKPPMVIAGHFDLLAETRDSEGGKLGLIVALEGP